jgi:hypothetical protein
MLKTANLETLAALATKLVGVPVTLRVEGATLVWDLPYEPLCKGFTCLGSVGGDLRLVFRTYTAWRNLFRNSLVPLSVVRGTMTTDTERQVYARLRA